MLYYIMHCDDCKDCNLFIVGGIVIRGLRLEFCGTGVHKFKGGINIEALAQAVDLFFFFIQQLGNLPVAKTALLA